MAWGKGGKGKKGQKPQKQQKPKADEDEPTYLKAVDPRWNLNKSALRGYASMTGSPFFAAQGQSDSDFLALANILENKMLPYTTEVTNRLGIALSEAGGTVSMGKELLEKYAAAPEEIGAKFGVQGVADLLSSPAGKAFVEAAAVFNKHDNAPKDQAALQKAAGDWVNFLLDNPKEKAKAVQRLVKSAARSYLLGMELLQWLSVAKNLPEWAKKLKPTKSLQPEKVQKWLREPSDKARLIAALVAAYQEQIDTNPKRGGQALSDSEASSARSAGGQGGSSAQQSGTDNSSSSDKKAKKKKKSKKDDKKAAKDKKKSEKDKKDKSKKKMKASKKSSNSSSASSKKASAAASGSESVSAATRRKRKAEPLDKTKEKKKPKGSGGGKPAVKVHRVTGAVDGKILVKKSDQHDTVEITEETMTVADVRLKLLTALGAEQDVANWNCMQLVEDGKIVAVAPELRAVELVGDLVMVAKGG